MDNDTQVLDPTLEEPIEPVTIEPETIDPASTETIPPTTEATIDPITGNTLTNPSNTSNDNQILVNSPITNISDSHDTYSATSIENNQTIINQTCNSMLDNPGKGTEYLIKSRRLSGGRGKSVARIAEFNSTNGDKFTLSGKRFNGIDELGFTETNNRRQTKKAALSDNDIIYERRSGRLFLNSNGVEKGFGAKGGLFAVLETSPLISSSDFILI